MVDHKKETWLLPLQPLFTSFPSVAIKHREWCFCRRRWWYVGPSAADRGEGKHITATNRKWHACVQRSVCAHKHRLVQTLRNTHRHPKTHIHFVVPSHTHTHRNIQTISGVQVASVSAAWRAAGLVCSAVCERDCLSHFTLCLQCLSESGAGSGGVTALICHADRLGNEKSLEHRSHTRPEQTLNKSATMHCSLTPHSFRSRGGWILEIRSDGGAQSHIPIKRKAINHTALSESAAETEVALSSGWKRLSRGEATGGKHFFTHAVHFSFRLVIRKCWKNTFRFILVQCLCSGCLCKWAHI